MKILWLKSDFPLPADTGGKIRTKCLLFELARLAEVTFLSYVDPGLETVHLETMREAGIEPVSVPRAEERKHGAGFAWRVLSRLPSPRPYVANKYVTGEMRGALSRLVAERDFDVVVIDFLEMATYAELLADVPTVLFEHNVETMIWRRHFDVAKNPLKRLYLGREKERMARFERDSCARADLVLTVSDEDSRILREEFDVEESVVVPTGVDTTYFAPRDGEIPGRIVLSGSMDWMPNIDAFWWFYRSIYPAIREAVPEVTLTVVGRRPPAQIAAIGDTDPDVEVTGTVEDVRPHMAAGVVHVVPLRVGGGTRIKIYEALAMRKCLVSTSIGAEGLPLVDGVHLALADGEAAFAGRVIQLLEHPAKRASLAEAGHRLVSERYTWRAAAKVLRGALEKTLVGRRD